jgi:hypothetical protein
MVGKPRRAFFKVGIKLLAFILQGLYMIPAWHMSIACRKDVI